MLLISIVITSSRCKSCRGELDHDAAMVDFVCAGRGLKMYSKKTRKVEQLLQYFGGCEKLIGHYRLIYFIVIDQRKQFLLKIRHF